MAKSRRPSNNRHKADLERLEIEDLKAMDEALIRMLFLAYKEARRGGKRRTHDEHRFEVNVFENLRNLRKDLDKFRYKPSRSTAHIIYNPVIREIFAAPFRDRIVHHLVFDTVYPWWDKHFIYDSYSCRDDKGTLFGIIRLLYHIRVVSKNFSRPAYVAKFDVEGYFMSLPRKELYERAIWGLDKQFEGRKNTITYRLIRHLWKEIIFDNPVKGARKKGELKGWHILPKRKSLFGQPKGKGIVIGNLTSQLLSNIYLDMLDRYIIFDLGYKHYGRYVDDFYIVVSEEELPQLKRDKKAIAKFLERKKLRLHPNKQLLVEARQGVPFLGAVVYRGYVVPGRRLKRNMLKACREVEMGRRDPVSVLSYMGHMKNLNSNRIEKKIFETVGWKYKY